MNKILCFVGVSALFLGGCSLGDCKNDCCGGGGLHRCNVDTACAGHDTHTVQAAASHEDNATTTNAEGV